MIVDANEDLFDGGGGGRVRDSGGGGGGGCLPVREGGGKGEEGCGSVLGCMGGERGLWDGGAFARVGRCGSFGGCRFVVVVVVVVDVVMSLIPPQSMDIEDTLGLTVETFSYESNEISSISRPL